MVKQNTTNSGFFGKIHEMIRKLCKFKGKTKTEPMLQPNTSTPNQTK